MIERMERAFVLLAWFIELDGDVHVPMYEKFEAELETLKKKEDTKDRAGRLLLAYKRSGGRRVVLGPVDVPRPDRRAERDCCDEAVYEAGDDRRMDARDRAAAILAPHVRRPALRVGIDCLSNLGKTASWTGSPERSGSDQSARPPHAPRRRSRAWPTARRAPPRQAFPCRTRSARPCQTP